MNRLLSTTAALLLAVASPAQSQMELSARQVATAMGVGWNLGNTLEAYNTTLAAETDWQDTPTTQELIDYVKSQGFKSVRIPTSWMLHTDKATLRIDPAWMKRVREVVDYCMHDSLYVVLNDHWDGGWLEDSFEDVSPATIQAKSDTLRAIWLQVAGSFAQYDEHLLFAGLNEPSHGYNNGHFTDDMMRALTHYEQVFIDAVRSTGGRNSQRVLVIQGPSTNIDETCKPSYAQQLPHDSQPHRLMVEVHFYDPWNFCGLEQDESWGSMAYYWGSGNHLDGSSRNAAWGEEQHVSEKFKQMQRLFVDRGYPVVLGEFGALWRTVGAGESQELHDASIRAFFRHVTHEALAHGIVPMVWDINHLAAPTMTILDRSSLSVFCQPAMQGIKEGMR